MAMFVAQILHFVPSRCCSTSTKATKPHATTTKHQFPAISFDISSKASHIQPAQRLRSQNSELELSKTTSFEVEQKKAIKFVCQWNLKKCLILFLRLSTRIILNIKHCIELTFHIQVNWNGANKQSTELKATGVT